MPTPGRLRRNEFAGYVGVALAGIATAYLATRFGARQGLLVFGLGVITLALLLTWFWVKDTLPWPEPKRRGTHRGSNRASHRPRKSCSRATPPMCQPIPAPGKFLR